MHTSWSIVGQRLYMDISLRCFNIVPNCCANKGPRSIYTLRIIVLQTLGQHNYVPSTQVGCLIVSIIQTNRLIESKDDNTSYLRTPVMFFEEFFHRYIYFYLFYHSFACPVRNIVPVLSSFWNAQGNYG